jgi:hypothetical protein
MRIMRLSEAAATYLENHTTKATLAVTINRATPTSAKVVFMVLPLIKVLALIHPFTHAIFDLRQCAMPHRTCKPYAPLTIPGKQPFALPDRTSITKS